MKKIVFLFFGLMPIMPSFAQSYHSFIQYGVFRDEYWAPELQFCTYLYGTRFWFQGDSVVNGQVYHKICSTGIHGAPGAPEFCPPYTVDTSVCTFFALMREDSVARKVFSYDPDAGVEYLLFDFSVSVGDSVMVGYPAQKVYIQNEWIETWADGSSRRKLEVKLSNGFNTYWIESLGASNDLWDPLSELCICPHGICCQQNGLNLYGSDCAMIVAADEYRDAYSGLAVNPNPASKTITMQTKGLDCEYFVIVDMLGRRMTEQHVPAGTYQFGTSVQNWPAGLYVVSAWARGKCTGIMRFQKI